MIEKIKALDCVAAIAQPEAYDLKISAKGSDGLDRIIDTIRANGGNIATFNTTEPTLEDVFLSVTGKEMRDHANEKASAPRGHGPFRAPRARVR
jgi:ABC-2 type transport system ATP-binding protein